MPAKYLIVFNYGGKYHSRSANTKITTRDPETGVEYTKGLLINTASVTGTSAPYVSISFRPVPPAKIAAPIDNMGVVYWTISLYFSGHIYANPNAPGTYENNSAAIVLGGVNDGSTNIYGDGMNQLFIIGRIPNGDHINYKIDCDVVRWYSAIPSSKGASNELLSSQWYMISLKIFGSNTAISELRVDDFSFVVRT